MGRNRVPDSQTIVTLSSILFFLFFLARCHRDYPHHLFTQIERELEKDKETKGSLTRIRFLRSRRYRQSKTDRNGNSVDTVLPHTTAGRIKRIVNVVSRSLSSYGSSFDLPIDQQTNLIQVTLATSQIIPVKKERLRTLPVEMRSIIARTSTLSRTCLLRSASNVSVPTSSILGFRSVSTTSTSASTSTAKTPLRSHSTTAISPASTAHCTLFPPTHSSTSIFKPLDTFAPRHIGPREKDVDAMLSFLGYKSMEEFVSQTVPGNIRIKELDDKDIRPLSELEFMRRAERLAAENKMVKSYIGMGYHNAIVPPVIQRNVSRVSRGRDLDRSR